MSGHQSDGQDDRLQRSREEELRLIAAEEKAERALARAMEKLTEVEQRLAKIQKRIDRRRAAVEQARAVLQSCQEARARGPQDIASPESQAEEPVEVGADEGQALAPRRTARKRSAAAKAPDASPTPQDSSEERPKEPSTVVDTPRGRSRPPRDDRAVSLASEPVETAS
jgi:hypothetical protein